MMQRNTEARILLGFSSDYCVFLQSPHGRGWPGARHTRGGVPLGAADSVAAAEAAKASADIAWLMAAAAWS